MSDTAIKRPAGVTIVGILTAILGVINIVFGVWILMYWLGIKLGTLFEGQTVFWLLFNGFLAGRANALVLCFIERLHIR